MLVSEFDLHLIGEGAHRRLWEVLGVVDQPGGAMRAAVWAPNASAVEIVGDWNQWVPEPLAPQGSSGVWAAIVGARPGQRYKFRVQGQDGHATLKADPMALSAECAPSDASVVAGRSGYVWGDDSWMRGRSATQPAAASPLRIYEVHLGSWRQGIGGYREIAEQLGAHVSSLGFTHVELLPVAEHPFGGSWGYQVSSFYAPTSRYGEPDDFRAFVDSMHRIGIGVIVDWVPAHFAKDAWSLGRFDGTALYEHADPRQGEHPDWGTYVFNYGRNEVRNFLVANALYWFDEFHVDGLRVDAVASMLYLDYSRAEGEWVPNAQGGRENLDAVRFLRECNSVVQERHPGVMMIAEESTSWPGVTASPADGGLGFTHKWNMGWMHDTLGYFREDPVHRRWHHGLLTFGLLYAFSESFVLPLSHDEVVHGKGSLLSKMAGDDWQRFANLRALYGWMWALPGAPLLFMGGELASWNEWNDGSSLPWHLLDHAPHRGVRDLVADLNAAGSRWSATWERDRDPAGFEWLEADDDRHSVYAFVRWAHHGSNALVCIANFTPVPRPGYRVGLPWPGEWEIVIDTDDAAYGGSGASGGRSYVEGRHDHPWQGQPSSGVLDLAPLGVVWIAATRRA
jgi:1,4-alpha-glucan branching enzyme